MTVTQTLSPNKLNVKKNMPSIHTNISQKGGAV